MRGLGRVHRLYRDFQATRNSLRNAVWRRLFNPQQQSRPVFLIGCGRSGTSMVIYQLNKSWQVEIYNEDHPLAFENFFLREFDQIRLLIEKSKAPITLFKPILETYQARLFLSQFPQAKLIFAFRHFDDVINSSLIKFGQNNRIDHVRDWIQNDFSEFNNAPPPERTKEKILNYWQQTLAPESGAALYWLFFNQLFFDLNLADNQRVFLLHYENLVQAPQKQLMALTEFLNIKFEKQMVDGIFPSSIKRDATPPLDKSIRLACDNLYQNLVAQSEKQTIV